MSMAAKSSQYMNLAVRCTRNNFVFQQQFNSTVSSTARRQQQHQHQLASAMAACFASSSSAAAAAAASSMKPNVSTKTIGGFTVEVSGPPDGKRVLVTKPLPGERWWQLLHRAGCRVELVTDGPTILSNDAIKTLMGDSCDGVVGQLTENWNHDLFSALKSAGGQCYSNYAVGYNNVDVNAATSLSIPVGNTPGVLTETTAELAAALTLAAARRVVEADVFMRAGKYDGWLPNLFIGNLLQNKTVGIVGAGRIGIAYAKMFIEGHKMNVLYYDLFKKDDFEKYVSNYGDFLEANGEKRVTCKQVSLDELLASSDVVSLHCLLDDKTKYLINSKTLATMKKNAVLINAARGPVINEKDLVTHLKNNPDFRVGLDVFEDEPLMADGLNECPNAVIVPHIASASLWTRSAMATLAAANVAERLAGNGVNKDLNTVVERFVDSEFDDVPRMSPSIVNADKLQL